MLHEFAASLPWEKSVAGIRRALTAAGLRVEQSFDLRAALALVPNCTCPHHGTAACDCHYSVLLAYGQTLSVPITLVVHGRDNRSWITVSEPPDGRAPADLALAIMRALAVARLIALDDDSAVQPGAKTL